MSEGHCMEDIIRFRRRSRPVLVNEYYSSANAAHHKCVRSRRADKATSDNSSFHQSSL
jgi:hypothetical protein